MGSAPGYLRRISKLGGKNVTFFLLSQQREWGEASCISGHFSADPSDQNPVAEAMESLQNRVIAECNFSSVA